MNHGSLFSGIGGFDYAAQQMGWNNVFHCEWNPFCQKILKYYWPNAQTFNDIKNANFTIFRGKIDVLSGGFPCQPFSAAGKRKGTEDERYLWPQMLRAIQEIEPRWIVGENVGGLVNWNGGLVFDTVCSDLENEGFEIFPCIIPACGVNAPHRRDRIWFIAYANGGSKRSSGTGTGINIEGGTDNLQPEKRGIEAKQHFGLPTFSNVVANTESKGGGGQLLKGPWEREFGRCNRENAIDKFENFPIESPICGGNDGISTKLDGITFPKWRNESIKGLGNAIVPQVAMEIFKTIEKFDQQYKPTT